MEPGGRAISPTDIGALEAGKKADVVLIKNNDSPVSFPLLNPFGQVAFQAQRGDVHTVLVDGRVVKFGHKLVGTDLPAVRREVDGRCLVQRSVEERPEERRASDEAGDRAHRA